MNNKQKKILLRIIISAALLLLARLGSFPAAAKLLLYSASYLIIGFEVLRRAFGGIRRGQVFDENFLMAVATVGAVALEVCERSYDLSEAVAVMLFYQIGELFESYAVGKSRRSISALMDIRPDYANIERDGRLVPVDPDEVPPGSIIIVQPGERVPIDGVVTDGSSSLNTAALTGESIPKDVGEGDEVLSGCINMTGLLSIRTTKEFGESTVSKILELVENSSSRKSRAESFISRFAAVYTPAVCGGALLLALVPPLVSMLMGGAGNFGMWIYRALSFLVISCPCALVISIPLSFFAGLGGASKEGILIKGSNYLELLSKVKTVAFDKTGTLTRGVFEVSDICPVGISKGRLLEYAALAEYASTHPISRSLLNAYGKEPDMRRVSDIREHPGRGISATVDGESILAGNARLMEEQSIPYAKSFGAGTVVYLAANGKFIGHIQISDRVKDSSAAAIKELSSLGIRKTVMLTGDNENTAKSIAAELGITHVYSELLPEDKVTRLEALLDSLSPGEKLAFVGDGINDAPVLALADLGIAMGGIGSDAAIEAADVILMDDEPMKLIKAIKLSRKCLRIVFQNIIFAIGVKLLCLLLGALGLANMWAAIFADVGVMVIAVLNAIRALNTSKL